MQSNACAAAKDICLSCRQSGSGSQSRKRKLPPQDTAVSSHGHLKGQANGKSVQKDGKRHRPFPAATSSAQSTGQLVRLSVLIACHAYTGVDRAVLVQGSPAELAQHCSVRDAEQGGLSQTCKQLRLS